MTDSDFCSLCGMIFCAAWMPTWLAFIAAFIFFGLGLYTYGNED